MIDIFRGLKSLLKINRVHIDNSICRLHYSLTVLILLAFCVVTTTKQYVGDPIDCIMADGVPRSVINTFCWIHTTYSVPSAMYMKVGKQVVHPGVAPMSDDPKDIKHHKYYQWVCFVLFFQATLFYIPRWLWKGWEGGKIQALKMDLDICVCSNEDKRLKRKVLLEYLVSSRGHHDWYAGKYFLSELLAFANVVGQMFMLDRFFDGEFMNYGLEVIDFMQMDTEIRTDPMTRIFPKMTKCLFYKYGPSATIESVDALCLLPLNIINEKIFIFIWFWFLFLAFLTAVMIVFHLIIIACPPVRVYVLSMRFRLASLNAVAKIVRTSSVGDWFVIYMLGNNIDSIVFRDLIEDLANGSSGDPGSKDSQALNP